MNLAATVRTRNWLRCLTVNRDTRKITYCGGGIAGSAAAFVMIRLGFTDIAVYCHSLQEWTADPDNPMAIELDMLEMNTEINI